jgi:hypothetical protein
MPFDRDVPRVPRSPAPLRGVRRGGGREEMEVSVAATSPGDQ